MQKIRAINGEESYYGRKDLGTDLRDDDISIGRTSKYDISYGKRNEEKKGNYENFRFR